MGNLRGFTVWSVAALTLLASPIIVIFSIPLAIGIGVDVFNSVGEVPFALGLAGPAIFMLARHVPLHGLAHRLPAVTSRPRRAVDRPA